MSRSTEEIQTWIVDRVSGLTGIARGEIDPRQPILHYGLDSVTLVVFASEVEAWLGYQFRENPFDAHPTIEALSRFLAAQTAEKSATN